MFSTVDWVRRAFEEVEEDLGTLVLALTLACEVTGAAAVSNINEVLAEGRLSPPRCLSDCYVRYWQRRYECYKMHAVPFLGWLSTAYGFQIVFGIPSRPGPFSATKGVIIIIILCSST
jgi:hypothetical protein